MKKKVLTLAALMLFLVRPAAYAADPEMMSLLESMKQQLSQMQSTIDRQNVRLQQLESSRVIETPQPSVPVQPSTAPMSDKAAPWLKGAKFGGDFRLRQEYFDYFDKNTDAGATDRSRNRSRVRLRWGFEKDFGDDWKTGFRLATGNTTDQVSTNATLGNPGYFTFKSIVIDKAYAEVSPNSLKDYGALKGATIGAGKFDNPFARYSTPILWDGDVTPEGLYEKARFQILSAEENQVSLDAAMGQFIVNENSGADTDAQLYGYQGALNWSTVNFGADRPVDLSLALGFYNTVNYSRTVSNNTAGTNYLRTNSADGDEFEIWDFYPEIRIPVGGRPLTLWYNFVTNTDDTDGNEAAFGEKEDAWGAGFKFGKAGKKGEWEAFWGYYEIEANAVMAAFSDADFGGPGNTGHTNRKGHKFGLVYQLTDAITVNWTGFVVRPLNPTTLVSSSANESVFRSQADLVYKF
ncbi:MAG: putative porin [Candidatus Omnitrophica bacterium]|nr:putative porin [Candidatus Omnitrophota bacterium]